MTRTPRRRDRNLGRHERISVAVAAYPGSKSERHGESEEITRAAELFLERQGQGRLGVRTRFEESRLQIPERRAHLIEHRRAILPHFTGEPEQLDFSLERLLDQTHFFGGSRFARQKIVSNPRLEAEQCTTSGFGWVGGKYRANVESEHRLLDRVGSRAQLSQLAHCPSRRRRLWLRDSFAEVGFAPPNAMSLLGGIDQEKEQRERTRGDRALLDGQIIDFAQQVVE